MKFWKMQSLGNDFVVLNGISRKLDLSKENIKWMADRHFGIGCDQVLVVEPPRHQQEDFHYRIFNADGREVGQCGNGARCLAYYIKDQGLSHKKELRLGTLTTQVEVHIKEDDIFEVNMGSPIFSHELIPYDESKLKNRVIATEAGDLALFVLSMGNPHAVTIVPDVSVIDVAKIGKIISEHPAFPEQTNVIFMELFNPGWVKCRIYERGAAETLACGSGACAALVAGREQSLLNDNVLIDLPGGRLELIWRNNQVWLKGSATKVFEGAIA